MSYRPWPTVARESREAPPPDRRDIAAEPIVTDEEFPPDNRYVPASGILTPLHAPMPGA
jgi:hypothetical protein